MRKTIKLLTAWALMSSFLVLSACSSNTNYCSSSNVKQVLRNSKNARAKICPSLLADNSEIAFLQQQGSGYVVRGDKTIIALPSDKLFEVNSDEFRRGATAILDSLVRLSTEFPNMVIDVLGNTDPIAAEDYNQRLSTSQSVQVAGYLWSHGVPNSAGQKVSYDGNGELKPIATNENLAGMSKNRNIMIVIHPKSGHETFKPPKRKTPRYTKTYSGKRLKD